MWDETVARVIERRANPATRISGASQVALVPPVDEVAIRAAEHALGFALPAFLKKLYTSVGNGGFGPGFGLVGLQGGYVSADHSLVDWYHSVRAADRAEDTQWPHQVVPICDWGCLIFSCVDCSSAEGRVLAYHAGELTWDASREHVLSYERAFAPTHDGVAAFFDDWARGVDLWSLMFEDDPSKPPRIGINPFTRKPMEFRRIQRLRRQT